jgi:hypothetical protein
MSAQTWVRVSAAGVVAGAVVLAGIAPAQARGDGGHGFGRMGPSNARTTAVNPATGADYEMPFVCNQSWTGTTRSSHSPSAYTIDWNTPDDLGKPALASAPGVVVKAVKLRDSYGNYVVVDHGNGYSSLYAHLKNITTQVGTFLDQGDLVGYVGGTGNVTGPHLHFEERLNGAYFPPYLHRATYRFGTTRASANCNDKPISGDWNGDGKADVGVYRTTPTGAFWGFVVPGGSTTTLTWGGVNDAPLVGDWDGNGTSEVGIRRLGTTAFTERGTHGSTAVVSRVGNAGDTPITGDWDGDGKTEVGSYRAANRTFYLRSAAGTYSTVVWGNAGDRAVSGDWSRAGHDEIGVFDPATATWTMRVKRAHGYATRVVQFGRAWDLPVTGDWNNDGVTDLGTWTPSTATFTLRTPGGGGYVTTTVRSGYVR